jgi:cell division septum initiation protein DivIVA
MATGFMPQNGNTGFAGPMRGSLLSNYMPQAPNNNTNPINGMQLSRAMGYGNQQLPTGPNPLQQQYGLYNEGVKQNAQDYGDIMGSYKDLLAKANSQPMMQTPANYNPSMASYQASPDYTNAIGNLKNLSETGGYSGSDIQNLRERGISPIRSVYANAQRNVDRQRRLGGGFSPNYNAVTAKMAREMSDQISNQMTNVNAGIAQNVAGNKLQVAPQYAGVAQNENQFMNNMTSQNADRQNQASQFNMEMPFRVGQFNQGNLESMQRALQGMTSLYGTTPAMSQLFGNQALNSAQFQNQVNQQGNQNGMQAVLAAMRQM